MQRLHEAFAEGTVHLNSQCILGFSAGCALAWRASKAAGHTRHHALPAPAQLCAVKT